MSASKTVYFGRGIESPAKLGNLNQRLTTLNKLSYAQNVNVANDNYGPAAALPGPALTTIDNNSQLTGVPFVRTFFGYGIGPLGYLYFGQSLLGSKIIIRRVKDIISGSTPIIDTGWSATIDHTGHTNLEIVDMAYRPTASGTPAVYISIKDDTDTAVYKLDPSQGSPSASLIQTNSNFTGGATSQFLVPSSFDNNLYWIGQQRVSSFDISDSYTIAKLALGLPVNTYASCGADWQQQLVVAYTNEPFADFGRRKSGGRAGIAIWDYVSPGITRNIPAPCRYISAVIPAPDGQLLVFGGVDEGKSTIYQFTGYGFTPLIQYIGDLPRNRHSVEFDAQGRILWLTADGFKCRYDRASDKFENLGRASSTGGILARGIGSPVGNDFIIGSGVDATYKMELVQFDKFIGDDSDNDSPADTNRTPISLAGEEFLPDGSTVTAITLQLGKSLQAGEKLELRIYKNGSSDYTVYMTMSFEDDDDESSKREVLTLEDINSYSLAVAWKMANGATTAPPVVFAEVETES